MTNDEITKLVQSYIDQSLDGQDIENAKFDFKAQWYPLNTKKGESEFIKDTCAIANTFGPDGFIVIGFNAKTKEFTSSPFSNSGKRDLSELTGLVNKKVDRLFDFRVVPVQIQGHILSVIHIPPSIDKPHVIRNYQTFDINDNHKRDEEHKIFIRKNSETYSASKYDLELMYYDRKNIIPDFEVFISISTTKLKFKVSEDGWMCRGLEIIASLFFENTGRRPVSISRLNTTVALFPDASFPSEIMHISTPELDPPIVIKPGEITNQKVAFITGQYNGHGVEQVKDWITSFQRNLPHLIVSQITLVLSNGRQINQTLEIGNP